MQVLTPEVPFKMASTLWALFMKHKQNSFLCKLCVQPFISKWSRRHTAEWDNLHMDGFMICLHSNLFCLTAVKLFRIEMWSHFLTCPLTWTFWTNQFTTMNHSGQTDSLEGFWLNNTAHEHSHVTENIISY